MPDYGTLRDQAITTLPGGGKTFAGQADDPFFLDLRVFDLLYGGDLSEVGQDTLRRLQRQHDRPAGAEATLALNGDADRNPVIGVWSTTERRTRSGRRRATRPATSSCRCPGWACRWSTRWSSRSA